MRCYLMRKGHIHSVEFLTPGTDEALIAQGKQVFDAQTRRSQISGFEVWDGPRRVYVYPDEPQDGAPDTGPAT